VTDDDDLGSAATLATLAGAATDSAGSLPSVIAERYEVLGLLGAGGMGRVYRVRDRKLDEVVALKVLRRELVDAPGMLERFRAEVRLARRVTSPHVVRTFDLGEHDDDHFLTMEYIAGQSLARWLDAARLDLPTILRVARAACDGIVAAHAAGVLHRDLKPDNILVGDDDRIAITDFGIAQPSSAPRHPGEGFLGTPAYMAPEQLDAEATVGPPVDIYAFGAILFEMLAERRPFLGGDPLEVALSRLHRPPPDPRRFRPIPDALAELVLACLAREPAARPASAEVLARRLRAIDPTAGGVPDVGPARPTVPAVHTSRAIAFLPLRATGDLVELADGLSEEIADALTMTRELRIRPITSVRAAASAERDVRALGRALDVDVVVEGSMRRRGAQVRITARAIGVADGFQLWASHFDTAPDGLLSVGDQVAREVARALTVEIELPRRAALDVEAVALYLESKAKLRALWFSDVTEVIPDLERAHALAPSDPAILATLAIAIARAALLDTSDELDRARELATRAVSLGPAAAEPWFALGLANLYGARHADAARALRRAVDRATGFANAQTLVGAILLEAGELDDAIAHLEAAGRLDPLGSHHAELPRAYIYRDGDYARATALLEAGRLANVHVGVLGFETARLRLWQGKTTDLAAVGAVLPLTMRKSLATMRRLYATGKISQPELAEIDATLRSLNARRRAVNAQFVAEFLAHAHQLDRALGYVEIAVAAGLHDRSWIERCPLLAPLRDRPRFHELAAVVATRADAVIAAFRDDSAG